MLGKITTGFQITLPAFFRKDTNVKIGDYVDIRQEDHKLIITPVTVNEKKEAIIKFNSIFSKEISDKNFNQLSEEEVIKIVNNEIKQSRDENSN